MSALHYLDNLARLKFEESKDEKSNNGFFCREVCTRNTLFFHVTFLVQCVDIYNS